KNLTSYVPGDAVSAQAFADAVMDGETKVYSQLSVSGTDTASTCRYVSSYIKDNTTGASRFLNFIIKSTKNEGDVIAALTGKTFDGIKADKVVITSMRSASF
ncbi:MAG: hypothetical protein PHX13_12745, partial [Thiovulaceae bacterium]|nr:hypothetical protein [Sulfurimonadaceae bacterium]